MLPSLSSLESVSTSAGPGVSSGLVEQWLNEIRRRMPAGAFVTATLQLKSQRGFLASFRLRTEEETLSSEARADSPDEAVMRAGKGLCEHLPVFSEEAIFGGLAMPRAS